MAMDAREIERLIKTGIPDAEVTVRDLAGDGDHYAATVIAEIVPGAIASPAASACVPSLTGQDGRSTARPGFANRRSRIARRPGCGPSMSYLYELC